MFEANTDKDMGLPINVVKIHEDSKLPAFSREGDACMDCYADIDVTIPPFTLENGAGRTLVPLGFKISLPHGFEALVRPRSGLALKNGITILNTPGTIDENYRGEVGAILVNTTATPFEVKKGDRVCQLAIRPIFVTIINLREVEKLDETNRNENGFGSSGK